MFAALLMARAGLNVEVFEKHGDFLRDFRGDTVHPSTMDLIDQLGWLDEFLTLPHNPVSELGGRVAGRMMKVADFRHLPVRAPFVAMVPQWDLLNFLAEKGRQYPGFHLHMNAEIVGMARDGAGRFDRVRLKDGREIAGSLIIAADGRHSILRQVAELPLEKLGAPMDVFWFRVPKGGRKMQETFAIFETGRIMVLLDRGEYWQCAFVIGKGKEDSIRSEGLEAFKARVIEVEPRLAEGLASIAGFDEIKLLTVELDRLTRWYRPGFLAIGDAAHAMSPVGGVGINLAIQDAVAAANILAGPMASGADPDPLLAKVQEKRMGPTRRMQALQSAAQNRLIAPLISGQSKMSRPPWPLRLLNAVPMLRRIPARIIGFGFGRESISSPDAYGR